MTAQQSSWGTCGFLLCVMQLATLLGFQTLLTSSCSGGLAWGWGCLATDVLLPHFGFLPFASAAPPSGFCALDGCVSTSDSSLLVYSWDWAGGIFAGPLGFSPMCRALPPGLQRALHSLMQIPLGFSGHRVSVLLLPW